MYFSLICTLIAAASLLPSVNAGVNAIGYSSTVSCGGNSWISCHNLPSWTCCFFNPAYGYSFKFENLPAATKGQGYRNTGCTDWIYTHNGPGTFCRPGNGLDHVQGANWFPVGARRELAGGDSGARDTPCVTPNRFGYTTEDNIEHIIKIPAGEGEAQKVVDAYAAKDFKALSAYEKA